MSTALLNTRDNYKASSYGSVSFAGPSLPFESDSFSYIVHANYTAAHAVPLFTNLINDAILKQYSGSSYSITTTMHPLPYTAGQKASSTTTRYGMKPG